MTQSNGMDSSSPKRHLGATLVNDINQSTEKRTLGFTCNPELTSFSHQPIKLGYIRPKDPRSPGCHRDACDMEDCRFRRAG